MKPQRRPHRSSDIFFYFFGICAVVFALTVVWCVVRTLDIPVWDSGQSLVLNKVSHNFLFGGQEPRDEGERIRMLHSQLNDSGVLFKSRPVIIWSNDFHIGPIQDLKHLLSPLGVKFIDKSLSNDCGKTNSCAKDLRVLTPINGINPKPREVHDFLTTYWEDPEMLSVDAFICFHPAAMCEVFMSFNRSLIVMATTRYEMGRLEPIEWQRWNDNLITISKDKRNIIATNNLYDAKYIEYFTGIQPLVLPSICDYITNKYTPKYNTFLLSPIHQKHFQDIFMKDFNNSCQRAGNHCKPLQPLREMYAKYEYRDLVGHLGIVHVPYQVSTMSLFEQYAMGIPLFVPTLRLLSRWHLDYQVIKERTWAGAYDAKSNSSTIPGHSSQQYTPDPNCDTDLSAIEHWLEFADFYQWPHIVQFDSMGDLVMKMSQTDLKRVSRGMLKHTRATKFSVKQKWRQILVNVATHSKNKPV